MGSPQDYTLTYDTVIRELKAPTAVAVGALGNGANGASSTGNFDKIAVAVDALIADNLNLRKVLAALITELKASNELRLIN